MGTVPCAYPGRGARRSRVSIPAMARPTYVPARLCMPASVDRAVPVPASGLCASLYFADKSEKCARGARAGWRAPHSRTRRGWKSAPLCLCYGCPCIQLLGRLTGGGVSHVTRPQAMPLTPRPPPPRARAFFGRAGEKRCSVRASVQAHTCAGCSTHRAVSASPAMGPYARASAVDLLRSTPCAARASAAVACRARMLIAARAAAPAAAAPAARAVVCGRAPGARGTGTPQVKSHAGVAKDTVAQIKNIGIACLGCNAVVSESVAGGPEHLSAASASRSVPHPH